MTCAEVNTPLLVHVDGVPETLRSRVEDVHADGNLAIARPSTDLADFDLDEGRLTVIEWKLAEGLARQTTVVVGELDVGIPAVLLAPASAPVVIQRRAYARVEALLPIVVEFDGGTALGTTLDLSGSGVRAFFAEGLEEGPVMGTAIALPGEEPVLCAARVVRTHAKRTYGMHFEAISDDDRERLPLIDPLKTPRNSRA